MASDLSRTIPRTLATLFGSIFVLEGITSILSPSRMEQQDFTRASSTSTTSSAVKGPPNPYIPLIHVRTSTFGFLVLWYARLGKWDVVGTVLASGVFVGLADAYYAWIYTDWKKGLGHILPTGVLVGVGAVLVAQG